MMWDAPMLSATHASWLGRPLPTRAHLVGELADALHQVLVAGGVARHQAADARDDREAVCVGQGEEEECGATGEKPGARRGQLPAKPVQ